MSVEFRNVVKRYGETVAVAGVSFTVENGKLVTLLGPSGCGKTTTLRMIAGLELPSEGRILIAGRDVTNLSATQRDVSMVFQSYALFPHMSVLENVCYGLRRSGFAKAEAADRAREGLKQVERALLEADVSIMVVRDFMQNVTEKAVGEEVLKSLRPSDVVIKIVYDELVGLMGPVDHSTGLPDSVTDLPGIGLSHP